MSQMNHIEVIRSDEKRHSVEMNSYNLQCLESAYKQSVVQLHIVFTQ